MSPISSRPPFHPTSPPFFSFFLCDILILSHDRSSPPRQSVELQNGPVEQSSPSPAFQNKTRLKVVVLINYWNTVWLAISLNAFIWRICCSHGKDKARKEETFDSSSIEILTRFVRSLERETMETNSNESFQSNVCILWRLFTDKKFIQSFYVVKIKCTCCTTDRG